MHVAQQPQEGATQLNPPNTTENSSKATLGITANNHQEQNHKLQAAGVGIVRGQSRNGQDLTITVFT